VWWKSKHLGKFMWGGFALLMFLTFVMPRVDSDRQLESPREQERPRLFDEATLDVEAHLQEGTLGEADAGLAMRLAPTLKIRQVARRGHMTLEEMEQAVELLEEFQAEIGGQSGAARETLRNHRNGLLLEAFPRLDHEATLEVLDEVREAYMEAFQWDPSG